MRRHDSLGSPCTRALRRLVINSSCLIAFVPLVLTFKLRVPPAQDSYLLLHGQVATMLVILRLLNFAFGVYDFFLAVAFLLPPLRGYILPPINNVVDDGAPDASKLHVLIWLVTILGVIRVHAALWPHDKSGYRIMCWSYILDLTFWGAQVWQKHITPAAAAPALATGAAMILLGMKCYRSAIGKKATSRRKAA
jgi:hypothetical protein